MREIKFRAWDLMSKKMIHSDLGFNEIDNRRVNQTLSYFFEEFVENTYGTIAPKVKLMQYTGLKDKNGKEIYEGDIIISTLTNIVAKPILVEPDLELTGFIPFTTNDNEYAIGEYEQGNFELIGNIYENKELLK